MTVAARLARVVAASPAVVAPQSTSLPGTALSFFNRPRRQKENP